MLDMQRLTLTLFGAFFLALSSPLFALISGQDVEGTFVINDLADDYEIMASAGSFMQVSMGVIDGGLQPRLRIFSPDGSLLHESSDSVQKQIAPKFQASMTGLHRIEASSLNGADGDYRLTAVSLPGPLSASDENKLLLSGEDVEGSIPNGDIDLFTIEANEGDTIRIGIGRRDDHFRPHIELVNPSGAARIRRFTSSGGVQLRATAGESGTFTVVVREVSVEGSGDYRLSAFASNESIFESQADGHLSCGQRLSSRLDFGDFDVFTFSANAGDNVRLEAGNRVMKFAQSGEVVGPNGNSYSTSFTAPFTGTYAALFRDNIGNREGDYQVSLATLPTTEIVADDGINRALPSGTTVSRSMGYDELHLYTFAGTNGDNITINLTAENGSSPEFSPRFRLIDPSGEQLRFHPSGSYNSTLEDTGNYYIVMTNSFELEPAIGDYSLTVTGQTGTSTVDFVTSPSSSEIDLTSKILSGGIIEISYPTSVTGLSLYRSQNSLTNFLPQFTTVENGRHVFRVTNPTSKEFFRLQP